MQWPNYAVAEFVSNLILNSGFSQMVSGVGTIASGQTFFIPGVVNPSALSFSYNGNLTVTVGAPSPFKVLFVSGSYVDAHGTTNGVDSSSYVVSFSSVVPSSGSTTAYLVASYGTVLESPYVVVGPPIGHPDYNTSFQPYTSYSTNQETLVLSATTTVPDNLNFVELARITLTAGQSVITSVDVSHQVLARLNINIPSFPLAFGSATENGYMEVPFTDNVLGRINLIFQWGHLHVQETDWDEDDDDNPENPYNISSFQWANSLWGFNQGWFWGSRWWRSYYGAPYEITFPIPFPNKLLLPPIASHSGSFAWSLWPRPWPWHWPYRHVCSDYSNTGCTLVATSDWWWPWLGSGQGYWGISWLAIGY